MPIFTEDEKQTTSSEDFVKLLDQGRKKAEVARKGGFSSLIAGIPVVTVIVSVLAVVAVVIAGVAMMRTARMSADIDEIKTLKAQMAAVENRLDAAGKEAQKVRAELAQAVNEIETFKAEKEKMEAELRRQEEARKKAAQVVPKKQPVAPVKPKKPQAF